jgi:hypothetical protein
MRWFAELYDVNTREVGLSAEARLNLRQLEAKTVWDQMRAEIDSIDSRTKQVVLPEANAVPAS